MLFSRVRGLPVYGPDGSAAGVVRALTVDAASARVTWLRIRAGRFGRPAVPWAAVSSFGPDGVVAGPSSAFPGRAPAHHEVLGRTVLSDAGERRGTVLDVAFDEVTGRVEAVFTTSGEIPPRRLLGLGDHALVVLAHRS